MASSPSIETLPERSVGLRPLRDMVIAPEINVFWDTKNRLRAFQRQKLLRQPLKPIECNLALFFFFFRFCAELSMVGLPLAKPAAARRRYLHAHMIVINTISPPADLCVSSSFRCRSSAVKSHRARIKG
jgi:hypothetical protein